jgi:nicotinate-nucleotide adenylyltransferase
VKKVRVALLGGSFNPPHVGHLLAAQYVHATQPVDEVWLVPSYRHPFGKELVAFEHRVRMCQLLCEETSGWLKTSEVERDVPGEGRTIHLIELLRDVRPELELFLVIGSDILKDLPSWKDFDRVEQLARVLVLYRAGYPSERAIGPPLAQISSTEVRAALEQGKGAEAWVPARALEYAAAHHLYSR